MQSLTQYLTENDALITIATSNDALFVSSLIAEYGYLQTAELRQEFGSPLARCHRVLLRLVNAGIIVHQHRPEGVFNGWVVTYKGLEFLASLGLADVDRYRSAVSKDTMELVEATLNAQRSFGNRPPRIEAIRSVLQSVPEDRQEWLAFAICYESIPDDRLQSLLAPPNGDAARLLPHSKEELTRLSSTKREKRWPPKLERQDTEVANRQDQPLEGNIQIRKDHVESKFWNALLR